MDIVLVYQIGNVLAYAVMLVMRLLGIFVHFKDEHEFKDIRHKYPIKFMPADWSFGIWYLILFLLALFAIFQALPQNRRETSFVERIGWLFMINALVNALWVAGFEYDWVPLTTFCMIVMVITSTIIYLRLWTEKQTLANSWDTNQVISRYWLVEVPFSIYFAWLCIETIINVSVQLYADPFKWKDAGEIWAIIFMLAIFGLGLFILYMYADIFFGLTIIWGLAGIAERQRSNQTMFVLAIILSVFLFFSCCFAFGRKMRENFSGRGEIISTSGVVPPL